MYATKKEILIIQLWSVICSKVTSLYINLHKRAHIYSIYLFLTWASL